MKNLLKNQRVIRRRKSHNYKKVLAKKHILVSIVCISVLVSLLVFGAFTGSFKEVAAHDISVQSTVENPPVEPVLINEEKIVQINPPVSSAIGSGHAAENRDTDARYIIQAGETLSEIAYRHNMSLIVLAVYNKIANPHVVSQGEIITIPSLASEKSLANSLEKNPVYIKYYSSPEKTAGFGILSGKLEIQSKQLLVPGEGIKASFSINSTLPEKGIHLEWDLGNGRKSFLRSPAWTYSSDDPGTYLIKLNAWDDYGRFWESNSLFVDVPFPGMKIHPDKQYITLNSPDQMIDIPGTLISATSLVEKSSSVLETIDEAKGIYKPMAPGFYTIRYKPHDNAAGQNNSNKTIYLFVSPLESVHNDRNDIDWYRTQFKTGTTSNCGPSTASMAIGWVLGEYVPVYKLREFIGWRNNGGTDFQELQRVMYNYGVKSQRVDISSKNDIFQLIDNGSIVTALYNMDKVSYNPNSLKNLRGQYYEDIGGHYLIVKGYSVDKNYLIVYDPIPNDWVKNEARYGDGISMIGKNRYYDADEFFSALKIKTVLRIFPN